MKALLAIGLGMVALLAGIAHAQPAPRTPDPYLWLEDVSSPRAMAWVGQENARSLGVLEKDPRYPVLYDQALKIVEATDKIPTPALNGLRVTNFWQDATHVRGIWRSATAASYATPAPAWRTLIDLDALSTADKANWVWHGTNCEPLAERSCLIMLSDGGEDADTEREYDVATGAFVAGGFVLPKSKQSVAWEGRDSLIVARDWGAGTMTASSYPFVVKRLGRGQPLSAATEIFRGDPGDVGVNPVSFADGAGHEVVLLMRGINFFENVYYLVTPAALKPLDLPRKTTIHGLVDGRLIVSLNEAWTPRSGAAIAAGALIAVDPEGRSAPETIFTPGPRQSVDTVAVTKGHAVAVVYDNVRGRAMSFTRGAQGWTSVTASLPDNAAITIDATDRGSDAAYVEVDSFLLPNGLWTLDARDGSAARIKTLPARFDASALVTEQFEAKSKDGTQVPYFIVHRRNMPLDGGTPAILNAYGGFQVSSTPFYSGTRGKMWLERGGAFALANIRGGGEFGPAWHEAAVKTKRQNGFDDFAAVAEDMIARKLTSPRRLGIVGGSNGGLLMGVELTQHPALWNAVTIEVPLLDMLRYEQLSAGASWVGEYGSVKVPEERAFLAGISPYDNLKRGVAYPEPFIWTTTKDDRVGPVQARKFAARMKEYGLPYLYWENTEGGHGAGANLKEQARARALEITYFTRRLMDAQAPTDR